MSVELLCSQFIRHKIYCKLFALLLGITWHWISIYWATCQWHNKYHLILLVCVLEIPRRSLRAMAWFDSLFLYFFDSLVLWFFDLWRRLRTNSILLITHTASFILLNTHTASVSFSIVSYILLLVAYLIPSFLSNRTKRSTSQPWSNPVHQHNTDMSLEWKRLLIREGKPVLQCRKKRQQFGLISQGSVLDAASDYCFAFSQSEVLFDHHIMLVLLFRFLRIVILIESSYRQVLVLAGATSSGLTS